MCLNVSEIKSPHFQVALEFASDLIEGRKIANVEQIQACQRFLDDLESDKWDFKSNQFDFAIFSCKDGAIDSSIESHVSRVRKFFTEKRCEDRRDRRKKIE